MKYPVQVDTRTLLLLKACSFFLLFLFFPQNVQAQTGLGDCTGAIEVCGNGPISSNASGFGTQEIDRSNACSSFEHNSLWIRIEITRSGTLGFILKPTDSSILIDYDFFVFGPDANCGNLGNTIRCSTTNPNAAGQGNNLTGMNDEETDTSEGPGPDGNSFVRSLDVLPGETYYIVIDRPIGESPFELEWTGTSTLEGSPFPEGVEVSQPDDLVSCGVNGVAEFNLFETRSEVTSQQDALVEYYASLENAIDQVNELGEIYSTTLSRKTIFVRVENPATGCYSVVEFDLIMQEDLPITTSVNYELCDLDQDGSEVFDLNSQIDQILTSSNSEDFYVKFYQTQQDAERDVRSLSSAFSTTGQTVFARVQELSGAGCYAIAEMLLNVISPTDLSGSIDKPNFRVSSRSFVVELDNEVYEFALNDPKGPYQESQKFLDLSPGNNILFVRGKSSCSVGAFEVVVPAFRAFVTPNNDGHNDYWRVDMGDYHGAVQPVQIFDRYGNFLAEIAPGSRGWDGKVNGEDLPSDDYWFVLHVPEKFEIKSHFSLVR